MAYNPRRRELFALLCEGPAKGPRNQRTVLSQVHGRLKNMPPSAKSKIDNALQAFFRVVQVKWNKCHRSQKRFIEKNQKWLDEKLLVSPVKPGRPRKVGVVSYWTKRRRALECLKTPVSVQEMALATETLLRKEGSEDAAKLVHEIAQTSPARASKIRAAWERSKTEKPVANYEEDQALSLFLQLGLTKDQYLQLRNGAKLRNLPDFYPSYQIILEAKKRCYPIENAMLFSEVSASVALQALLDHTAERILLSQEHVIHKIIADESCLDGGNTLRLKLVSKWGCDGSSGHSNYKQGNQANDPTFTDSSIFLTCLVPLDLHRTDQEGEDSTKIIWYNIRPSSTRFCRPIRFQFLKESNTVSLSELEYMENQIKSLKDSVVTTSQGVTVTVSHTLIPSMVDGKVCSALTEISCQRCHVCEAFPKEMNNIDKMLTQNVNRDTFRFGCSPLHARIRCLETVLHISYKLDIKQWQARTAEEKASVDARKQTIQAGFKTSMGLPVDYVKQGSGSTNDGNTSRRVFQDVKLTSKITGFDEGLLDRLSIILDVLSSNHKVKVDPYRAFCLDTARLFVHLYGWYKMPSSLHKILLHSADIIEANPLPVGSLSEEAQESRNKDLRRFRESHSRKCNRTATNEDMFRRLLVTSDPFISSLCATNGNASDNSVPPRPSVAALLDIDSRACL